METDSSNASASKRNALVPASSAEHFENSPDLFDSPEKKGKHNLEINAQNTQACDIYIASDDNNVPKRNDALGEGQNILTSVVFCGVVDTMK